MVEERRRVTGKGKEEGEEGKRGGRGGEGKGGRGRGGRGRGGGGEEGEGGGGEEGEERGGREGGSLIYVDYVHTKYSMPATYASCWKSTVPGEKEKLLTVKVPHLTVRGNIPLVHGNMV